MRDGGRRAEQGPSGKLRFEDSPGTSGHIGPKSKKQYPVSGTGPNAPPVAGTSDIPQEHEPPGRSPTPQQDNFAEAPAALDTSPPVNDALDTSGQIGPKSKGSKYRHDSEQARPSERLRRDEAPPGDGGASSGGGATSHDGGRAGANGKKAARDSKRMNKSKFRAEKTGAKLDKARDKLANQKPSKKPGVGKTVGRQAHGYVHKKINEVERENVGVEAAHKTELVGESVVRGTSRFVKRRIRTRPTRRVRKWEHKNIKARADYEFRKLAQEHPELKKNALSRYLQKRKIKKQYQKQAREAAKRSAQAAKKTATTTGKIAGAVWRFIRSNPKIVLIIAILFLLIVILQSCMAALTTIGNGIMGAVGGTSYLAEDADIDRAELAYTEWETDLQLEINNAESTHPGFDEYRYSVGDISHNPYELMAFLTAVYDDFSYSQIESVLREIFNEQYNLTLTETTETRTETRVIEVGEAIGQVRTTAYCACSICCGPYANGITASGTRATANKTIAVDAYNPIVPMGTKVVINGVIYTVEDTGNLNANSADIDIYFATHAEALAWGRRTHTAYLAEGNSNTVEVTLTETVRILNINLTARSFTSVAYSRMNSEQLERYNVYMATKGNRQYLESPFGDTNWLPYVTSYYGYRVHPTTGAKNYHKGVDIGLPEGTEILAGQDGTVTFAGNSGDYGLVVVLDDGNGLVSKYAHCSILLVSAGQTVQAGDVIAKVGSTGNSTGSHLHLEVIKDGQYLNPLYFAVTNDYGQGPEYNTNPGAAMGDGSYAALIAEAEKYLGYPYVWGGSSPSTSFDCSGYICWILNQSGVASVGRTTAQGLYNLCTPVSASEAKPGDLIFFTGTYSAGTPVTHIGLYVGGGKMLHCGNPIQYTSINTSYWQSHFYSFGRIN